MAGREGAAIRCPFTGEFLPPMHAGAPIPGFVRQTVPRLCGRAGRVARALAVLVAIGASRALAGVPAAPVPVAPVPVAPVPVGAAHVTLTPAPHVLRVLAEVDSLGKTTLAAPVTGEIAGPFLTEGEVAAGAVVARNIPATLRGGLAAARADLAFAQATLARTTRLAAQHLRTQLAVEQARQAVAQAQARLAGLEREAAQQVLRAPFAGTLHYLVAPGTVVFQGTPVATLSGRATPWIDARIPPDRARGLHPDQIATIAAHGWHGIGRIAAIGSDARPLGLLRVRIRLPADNTLLPGEWVWVRLIRPGPPAPSVPQAAVVMRGARAMVFVLAAGHAHAVPVRVLAEAGGRVWLRGALHPGQTVAVAGATRLAEATRVVVAR